MNPSDVVGVVPAAGKARRLGDLPFSKELLPVQPAGDEDVALEPVCSCLLRAMGEAGIRRVFVVARPGKRDLLAYLSDGDRMGLELAYVLADRSLGPVHSVERACSFVGEDHVAFGFPDIVFRADRAFSVLLDRQEASNADVVIGTFPTASGQQADRVDVGPGGSVLRIDTHAGSLDLRPSWCLALWAPSFTAFLLQHVRSTAPGRAAERRSRPVGDLLQAAVAGGLRIQAEQLSSRPFVDIGTPEGLAEALRRPE